MKVSRKIILLGSIFLLFLNGCGQESQTAGDNKKATAVKNDQSSADLLADALSATYPAHARESKVVDWEGNVLQEGSNGYTCMPTPAIFAARNVLSPMCLDEVWMAWAHAWQNKKPFKTSQVGIAYMLAGDGGASNIDPYAEGPTDDNQWIVEGPHLMIIAPDPAMLKDIPTDPSSGGPYVMWLGTEYEHVMVPVKGAKLAPVTSKLADARSAADTNMMANVAVMDWDGSMLQAGGAHYTCMPTPPGFLPGRAPMCFDKAWSAWGDAWQNKKPFSTDKVGLAYMLAGDEGASNIDPFAEAASADNEWVVEGPHMMLIAPDLAMLSGIARHQGAAGPYVMWDKTPYAHVMIPTDKK